MPETPATAAPLRPEPALRAGAIALLYCAVAAAWIVGSDFLVGASAQSGAHSQAHSIKGAAFVAVTGAALYAMLAKARSRTEASRRSLVESERRFRALADASPVLIWMAGTDKKCEYFNRAWLEFTGRTFEQERGDGWAEGVHPDDLNRCLATYVSAFDARRPFTMEYRLRRADGVYRWIHDTGAPRHDPGGAFAGYIGSCVDLSGRKEAELESARVAAEFSALIGSAMDAIIAVDESHRVRVFNAAAERMFGVAQGAALGKPLDDFLPARYRGAHKAHVTAFAATGATSRRMGALGDLYALRADGAEFPIEASISKADAGPRRMLTVILRDISERKAAQAALRESESRYRALVEHAPVGIFVMQGGSFAFLNDAAARMLGVDDPGALLGSEVSRFISPSSMPNALDRIERLRRGEAVPRNPERWLRVDGSAFDVEVVATPCVVEGREGFQVIFQDISDRVTAERRQSIMMQVLNHRVKNNLTAVLALADRSFEAAGETHEPVIREVRRALSGRIMALAGLHTLLSQNRWDGVGLRALAELTLRPYAGSPHARSRVSLEGPEVTLSARAASTLCMALHELATNAVKYGALSAAEGAAEVRWRVETRADGVRDLRMTWKERGGPRVETPTRRGFGTTLIEQVVAYELGGEADLRFEPAGLECDITAPLFEDETPDFNPPAVAGNQADARARE